jgi:hypothetical protein
VDNSVEVRYAGVIVGRGALVKELGPEAAFVNVPEPMPVGTLLTLKLGDSVRQARVEEVVEAPDPTMVGMRVRWGGAEARAAAAPAVSAAPEAPSADSGPAATASPPSPPSPDSGPTPIGDSGPVAAIAAGDEGSGAIPAPLSLAGPGGDGAAGGGKRRRKRR